MDQATILRYQPGGDIYASIAAEHGTDAAGAVAAAALSGDETQINAALAPYQSMSGNSTVPAVSGPTTTLGVLETYSPADVANNATNYWGTQANSVGATLFKNLFGNSLTYFVLLIGGVVLFFYLGGPALLKGYVKRKAGA